MEPYMKANGRMVIWTAKGDWSCQLGKSTLEAL